MVARKGNVVQAILAVHRVWNLEALVDKELRATELTHDTEEF